MNDVIRASRFHADLAAVLQYFLEQDVVRTATRFLAGLEKTIAAIGQFPEIGIRVRSKRHRNVRLRQVRGFRNYFVAFRRGEQVIVVMRLVHGRRDLERLLNE